MISLTRLPIASLLAGVTALLAAQAMAQTAPAAAPPKPLWEVGAAVLGATQPAYPGAATRTSKAIALPFVVYRGEIFRADQGNVGLRAVKTPRYELDVGFAGSLGSSSKDVPSRLGMQDLGTLVEFGPRLKVNLGDVSKGRTGLWVELPLRGVFDLSHSFASRGVNFEPQLSFDLPLPAGWVGGGSVATSFGSQQFADTFYGVTAAQATANRPAYTAKSGLITTRATLAASKRLTPDVRLLGFVRLDSVAGGANRASSLVEKTNGLSAGLGLTYTFGRSATTVNE
jgi:MipA family protein